MKRLFAIALLLIQPTEETHPVCPDDMVLVKSTQTCVDRYEWPNQKGVRPAVAMTGVPSTFDTDKGLTMDATRLCASIGKRPCQLDEWVDACRGPGGSDYPFGAELPRATGNPADAPCNYQQMFRKVDEMKVFLRDPEELERLNQSDLSGARGCVSGSGAEDMMGNVEEWIQCPSWLSANGWCLAGRYWSDGEPCNKMALGHVPTWHYYETGFRCCRDPDQVVATE